MTACKCNPGAYKDGVCRKCGELAPIEYEIRRMRTERQSKWVAVPRPDGWSVKTEASLEGKYLAQGLPEDTAKLFAASGRLLANLEELVWCVRDGQLGDYSPLMDEIFDSEYAIKDALGEATE